MADRCSPLLVTANTRADARRHSRWDRLAFAAGTGGTGREVAGCMRRHGTEAREGARTHARAGVFLAVALALGAAASACSGVIGDRMGGRCEGCEDDGSGTGGPGASGSAGSGGAYVGPEGIGWTTRFPRLSHAQWEATVQDLLHLDGPTGLSGAFAPDSTSRFDNNVVDRKVGEKLWQDYQSAAETLAKTVAQDAAKRAKILPADFPTSASAAAQASAFVKAFGRRAFRRPLTDGEVTAFSTLYVQGGAMLGGDALAAGVEITLRAMLQTPQFLYRIESATTEKDGKIWLSGFEVASRLSYALWGTMPSDALLDAAAKGDLDTADGVAAWATKMTDDPRAAGPLVSFHEQLLRTDGYGTGAKDAKLFPTYGKQLQPVLQEEARLFFEEIVAKNGGGIQEVLTSPVAFVTADTAPFYGLGAGFDQTPKKVTLDAKRRAGILTQVGFLSKNGGLVQSDPIHRGVTVAQKLLCLKIAAPNMVPALPAQQANQTNRQRIEAHTGTCGKGCHDTIINPVGFALEHFDTVGAWRDQDNGLPIDAKASYGLDGTTVSFDGAVELMTVLAKSKALHTCYAQNWLEWTLGREVAPQEQAAVLRVADASKGGSGARALLSKIAGLDQVRARPLDTEAGK